jgi:acetyl esterase
MGLDQQVKDFLAEVEASGEPPLWELEPAAARARNAEMRDVIGPGPEVALVEDFTIPAGAGSIPARRYEPDGPVGTILWLHGGGWVLGDLESHDAMCRILANSSGCRVIAIDYRLAPEHPFPAPLEDCWDALRWVGEHHRDAPLVVAGDSAGGNLAAVCALRARDRGGPALTAQVLIYPVCDSAMDTPSYTERGEGPDLLLTASAMRWFWGLYLTDPALGSDPEASPLRAEDLSGLPPAIVVTAEYDPLRDEGLQYADRLEAAGVPVTRHHHDDMIHAFFSYVNLFRRGNETVAQVGGEIRDAVLAARPAGSAAATG